MENVLYTRYSTINEREQGKYLVQTRSQSKTSGTFLPEVHGIDKEIDPNIILKMQVTNREITPQTCILPETKAISRMKPRISQGRAGIKRKTLIFPQHDEVIPVPNYTIPKTMSEHDLISRTITRKGMQDF